MNELETFYGPNAGYVLDLYDRYKQDPASVDADTRSIFDTWTPDASKAPESSAPNQFIQQPAQEVDADQQHDYDVPAEAMTPQQVSHIVAASALAHAIRERGHLGAQLDPLGSKPLGDPALLLETYGLTNDDLVQLPPSIIGGHAAENASNALEAINALRSMYSGTISYEFDQVKSAEERRWLRDAVGLRLYHTLPNSIEARKILKRLTQVEGFEHYLHQSFVGQKRFSIEGLDTLIPMLDELIRGAIDSETREIIIGMAHRGRLNVLAHVLDKPYGAIFTEFSHTKREDGLPLTDTFGFGWSGDVKYHLGAEHIFGEDGAHVNMKIVLPPNPSHLEYVNPVAEGMARAEQETRTAPGLPKLNVDHTLPIVIHGDAAFPGEGIVAETLNLWHLKGYWVGGTIHIISNNQLGFTTNPEDSRSTIFASDLAKGFAMPIIHVNADDPYACLTAVRMAHAYRDHFHKDVLIDLVGYRRWGHNEGDEPAFTQPKMYEIIRSHPTVRALFAQRLEQEGLITHEEVEELVSEVNDQLESAKQEAEHGVHQTEIAVTNDQGKYVKLAVPPQVSPELLSTYNNEMLTWPQGFELNAKLTRTLQRRANALGPEGGIDWGQAEALAFASILADGTPIRITGQDSERGTFSHRHAALHGQDGSVYIPLQHLSQAKASFSIYNSPLSESAVMGFEYGYSVQAADSLVIWEAQFGDFANVAQVIIDQFVTSGRAKWKQQSSLILLLPHGYEGQGPEHSSARLERYLQLAAEDNIQVANCSTSAQYYHLLRQQAYNLQYHPRPLIVMTPKSLLRHPLSSSRLEDLTQGTFQPVIDDAKARVSTEKVRRVVLCTGKIAIDLLSHESRTTIEDIAIVRVELLYPFPAQALKKVLAQYPNAHEIVWVQEEPRNMGAWKHIEPYLNAYSSTSVKVGVISRPDRSSPATGFWDWYTAEQEEIMSDASRMPLSQLGGNNVR